jgi:hypothetical protein
MLIEGMGKLHLEISVEKLRGKEPKRLEISSKQPKIVFLWGIHHTDRKCMKPLNQ